MNHKDYDNAVQPFTIENAENVPFRDASITFIQISDPMVWANWLEGKRKILDSGFPVLIAWNGRYRADIFKLDDTTRAIANRLLK